MNIYLLGNGFDLHHKFPTRYIDFLHTIQFLSENSEHEFSMVGDVFGNESLKNKNGFIKECYDKHGSVYSSTPIQSEELESIISRANNNMWFKYLCNCVSKDIRWIDFEKEIIRVLQAFNSFFNDDGDFSLYDDRVTFDFSHFPSDAEDRHIISQFNFFIEKSEMWQARSVKMMCVKNEYITEKVVGSDSYHLMEDDIVSELYVSLRELADILRDYLKLFVDNPAKEMARLGIKPYFASMSMQSQVYSFNYTNTLEILYGNNSIDHIHGNTDNNIVLGVNPDENDEYGNVDTTFLQFKKYFQRVFFRTDISFLTQMRFYERTPKINDRDLYVIGHSLDSTDEDVIRQIFESAKTITILYHNETSIKDQIKNLVEIYGKEGLDVLREVKDLQFVPQAEIRWE